MLRQLSFMLLLTAATAVFIHNLPGFNGTLPFNLQTGYIGVGESEQVQLFYYFIHSQSSPQNDPLLLWLTGGPGCSAFSGLVYEIGPLVFNYSSFHATVPTLVLNPYSWTKVANIIFLDQPAGAGFSYATTAQAYKSSDTLSATLIYEFLQKWLLNHPEFLKNPLYISGDSYSGITVPLVVNQVYKGIEAGSNPVLNMKGYILGNPYTDAYSDINGRVSYAHRMGLLSDELYQSTKENCHGDYLSIDASNNACKDDLERVTQCLEKIRVWQIIEPWCGDTWIAPRELLLASDEGPCFRDEKYLFSKKWANVKLVQEALQVNEGTITEWVRCNATLTFMSDYNQTASFTYDVKSTVDDHKEFTYKDCRALVYSGDHDMVVPHTATEEWIKSLKLQVRSRWRPWFVEGQVAGYTMEYFHDNYELTYATVKGAGHVVPEYKPEECFHMIRRWLGHVPL